MTVRSPARKATPAFLKKSSKKLLVLLSRRFLQRAPKGNKSFLVLFFKKELLALLDTGRALGPLILLLCCTAAHASQVETSAPERPVLGMVRTGPVSQTFYVPADQPTGAVFDNDAPLRGSVSVPFPVYPKTYAAEAREGTVCISCAIDTAGRLTDCYVAQVRGGRAFGQPGLSWIEQPGLRVAPMTLNGAAVAGRHSFILQFKNPS